MSNGGYIPGQTGIQIMQQHPSHRPICTRSRRKAAPSLPNARHPLKKNQRKKQKPQTPLTAFTAASGVIDCLVNSAAGSARGELLGDSVSESITLSGTVCIACAVTAGPRPS